MVSIRWYLGCLKRVVGGCWYIVIWSIVYSIGHMVYSTWTSSSYVTQGPGRILLGVRLVFWAVPEALYKIHVLLAFRKFTEAHVHSCVPRDFLEPERDLNLLAPVCFVLSRSRLAVHQSTGWRFKLSINPVVSLRSVIVTHSGLSPSQLGVCKIRGLICGPQIVGLIIISTHTKRTPNVWKQPDILPQG